MEKLYFNPTLAGYNQYRNGIHINCITGFLHTIFMPLATLGFFLFLKTFDFRLDSNKKPYTTSYTNIVFLFVLGLYELGYFFMFPIVGSITIFFYFLFILINLKLSTIDYMKNPKLKKFKYRFYALLLITVSVGIMEFLGHGYLEHKHSNIFEFFNSIFHTPVYGLYSLYYPFVGQCKF